MRSIQCQVFIIMYDIYLIKNLINGKQYVGCTKNGYRRRFYSHINGAMNYKYNSLLHQDIRKYGKSAFTVECLKKNIPENKCYLYEHYFIMLYGTYYANEFGYNMTFGGKGVFGYIHTNITKKNIRNKLIGYHHTESRNNKIRKIMTNRVYLPIWREHLSKAVIGKRSGKSNPFYGKKHTYDTKLLISSTNTRYNVIAVSVVTTEEQEFFNSAEAAKFIVDTQNHNSAIATIAGRIRYVCNNGGSAYGYYWNYKERSID